MLVRVASLLLFAVGCSSSQYVLGTRCFDSNVAAAGTALTLVVTASASVDYRGAQVRFEADALGEGTRVLLCPAAQALTVQQVVGPTLEVQPQAAQLAFPARVTLPFALPFGTYASDLVVVGQLADGSPVQFKRSELQLNLVDSTVSFSSNTLGRFAVALEACGKPGQDDCPAFCAAALECPTPLHGQATCESGRCGAACEATFLWCQSTCAPCPASTGVDFFACAGAECAPSCATSYRPCQAGCCSWSLETVDAAGNQGQYTALALEASGAAHLGYFDLNGSAHHVRYAHRGNTGWETEVVAAVGLAAAPLALALDSQKVPHLAFYDASLQALRFASRTAANTWVVETIDARPGVGSGVSLAINQATGEALAAFYDGTLRQLVLATRHAGSWAAEVADAQGDVGQGASLALDPAGTPVIAYADTSKGALKCARRANNGWQVTTVDANPVTSLRTSLAIDAAGALHVAYSTSAGLWYATGSWGALKTEVVATGLVGHHASLAVDSSGRPQVSYEGNAGELRLARRLDQWTSAAVDATGTMGFTSLSLDGAGLPHIGYYDFTRVRLRLAE